jgi:cell division initiation protein
MEETMNSSLIIAQQTADNIRTNAQQDAEKLIDDAKRKITEIFLLYQDIIKRLNMFNLELKGQVAGQLEMLEKNQKKVEEMTDFFFGKDIKEVLENLEKVESKGK